MPMTVPADGFRAKPSLGWLSLMGLVLLVIAPIVGAAISAEPPAPDEVAGMWFSLLLMGALAAFFLVVVVFFPRMRYELGVDALTITYGPLLRYVVPYRSITAIELRNLRFSPQSSFRFPGLALWRVAYLGTGQVRMCSTRSHRGVLIITAGDKRYGISPEEEGRFVHELRARVERFSGSGER